ncbi:MAG: MFS transporter [Chlamydiota bacterium]
MEPSAKSEKNPAAYFYGWVLFFLNTIVVAYTSSLEALPSLLSSQLTLFYNTKISTITYIFSFYYYAFIIFQIPAALLIDKYRTNFFITIAPLITGLSACLLAQSHTLITAGITRFFMGIGSALAFLHAIKCIADWFPAKTFAFRFGLFIAIELVLTVAVSALLNHLTLLLGWHQALIYFGIAGLILTCLVFLITRRFQQNYEAYFQDRPSSLKPLLRKLFDSSQMWVIGMSAGLSTGIIYAFLGRWAKPIFTLAYNLSALHAMALVLIANVGYVCGNLLFPYFSTLLKRRKTFIPCSLAITIIMLVVIVYPPYFTIYLVAICSFLLGFSISAANLGYVIIHEQNATQITATAIASINIFYSIAIAAFDGLITNFLRFETTARGATQYSLQDFESALFRLPIYFIFALIFSFFIRETHAEQLTS